MTLEINIQTESNDLTRFPFLKTLVQLSMIIILSQQITPKRFPVKL